MQPLLLLHGAIGAKDQLEQLEEELAGSYEIHRINFSGHGGMPYNGDLSIAQFAAEVIDYCDSRNIISIDIFGYSMGGYVAMFLAKHFPARVNRIITLATKFLWTEEIAAQEIKMLNAAKLEEKLPLFASALAKRHAPNDWKILLDRTAAMLTAMGKDNPLKSEAYKDTPHRSLIMLGDRDKMVTLAETLEVYHALPNAALSILPNTAHPIEVVKVERLAFEIRSFLEDRPDDAS
jgi:pimeloyl-ACP methyl ester carboxylesterase